MILIFIGVVLSAAAPKSLKSTAFDEWLKTFDPSTAVVNLYTLLFICFLELKKMQSINN